MRVKRIHAHLAISVPKDSDFRAGSASQSGAEFAGNSGAKKTEGIVRPHLGEAAEAVRGKKAQLNYCIEIKK